MIVPEVTVRENVHVPASVVTSEVVPEAVYVPAESAPVVVTAPEDETTRADDGAVVTNVTPNPSEPLVIN